jgi:putative ABC transport system permease protein
MLKNYLTVAWRNLVRNKTFSLVNIVGLAIGLSSFLLIALYVMDELSFDRYYDQAGNIYRIDMDDRWGGQDQRMAQIGDPIGPKLKNDYSRVEEYTRIFYSRNDPGMANKLIRKGNEYITEDNTAYVDSTFFNVFKFPALEGDTRSALNEPRTVVITASTATKYFGSAADAMGKTLAIKDPFLHEEPELSLGTDRQQQFLYLPGAEAGTGYKDRRKRTERVYPEIFRPHIKGVQYG